MRPRKYSCCVGSEVTPEQIAGAAKPQAHSENMESVGAYDQPIQRQAHQRNLHSQLICRRPLFSLSY